MVPECAETLELPTDADFDDVDNDAGCDDVPGATVEECADDADAVPECDEAPELLVDECIEDTEAEPEECGRLEADECEEEAPGTDAVMLVADECAEDPDMLLELRAVVPGPTLE